MSTYQEQIERAAALKKTKVIEGIFEDIRAGKYFGADALSKAFDAGVASCVVTEARPKTVYQAPSGFKLMPEHPTSEMLEAIEGYFRKWQRILPGVSDDDVKADAWSALHAYHAMYEIAPVSPQQALTKARIDEAHSYFSKTAAEQGADHGEQYGFKHRLYAQGVEECYICALLRENTELRANAKEKP